MVEILLRHEAYNLVTQSLGKYNFDKQRSAGGSQQDRSDRIIKFTQASGHVCKVHTHIGKCDCCTLKTF